MKEMRNRIEAILDRIERASARAGRDPSTVRLMAVSKLQSPEALEKAYQAGMRLFGENRVQEAWEKFSGFHPDAELHIIGHLQSNKAKKAAEVAACIQSIDKLKTAAELEKRCEVIGKVMDIYLEFNTSGEESKSGYRSRDVLFGDLEEMCGFQHLRIRGLMTIGPLTGDEREIRRAFGELRMLYEQVEKAFPDLPLGELSMGMSSDFEIAIEEGASMVRVGTALFGPRM